MTPMKLGAVAAVAVTTVVAGFSRGVTLAYAYACAEPMAVAGLVALDGAFKNHAPKGQYDRAAEAGKLAASGAWANDVSGKLGWDNRQKLMNAAAAHPSAPAHDAKFPTIGAQVGDLLYNAWRPGALANPVEGLSRPEILARLLERYGHLDVVVGEHARRDVFEPTLAWILARAGAPSSSSR